MDTGTFVIPAIVAEHLATGYASKRKLFSEFVINTTFPQRNYTLIYITLFHRHIMIILYMLSPKFVFNRMFKLNTTVLIGKGNISRLDKSK